MVNILNDWKTVVDREIITSPNANWNEDEFEKILKKAIKTCAEWCMACNKDGWIFTTLSGGLDSSCVAYLSAEAFGRENVYGFIMPYKTTPQEDIKDAQEIGKILGIKTKHIDITDAVEAYFGKVPSDDRMRRGNKMARERMSIVYDQSKALNALVIGTSNRTETLLGYGTIYGDTAAALMPLGGLYKTQVRQLAQS